MNLLKLTLFGKFHATFGQEPLPMLRTSKVQALLVYLAVEHAAGQAFPNNTSISHRRETLMDLLWSDMPLKSAQANLRQTLYQLRKMIPDQHAVGGAAVHFLESSKLTVGINPVYQFQLDVAEFISNLHQGRLEQAADLYHGDFLEDFYLVDSAVFESWAQVHRATYRRQVLEALTSLAIDCLKNGSFDQAVQHASRQLELDNLREPAYRQAMEALARRGNRQQALVIYESLCARLDEELAVEPEARTIALVEAIRSGDLADDTFARSSQPFELGDEPELPRHNLPQRLTSFVGRQEELAEITSLIANNRLVMLTGVGGIGKTNLSLEVGCTLLDQYPDGVWLVELAPVADPALVPQTAASVLGIRASSDQPVLQILLEFLYSRKSLLILDNCEHLIDAAAQFAETILQNCPDVKILATSRETFSIPGEITYAVLPLSFPDDHQLAAKEEWEQYPALRLFVDRATAVLPAFHVTEENVNPIVQICRQLDGIPLALELAAARVKVLTTEQIFARLDDRFQLLTGGSRTAMPRHQTLRALIDWSWELLEEAEQLLLMRLSVFAGGMNLEAVEAVCSGDGLDAARTLDLLSELANKSLVTVRRAQGQETRYRLLEMIRQYARQRLVETDHEAQYRDRHLRYFLYLGEEAEQALVGPDQVAWLKRLENELNNIRAALKWAVAMDVEAGLRLCTKIWRFWDYTFMSEGEKWLAELLVYEDTVAPELKAKALWTRGLFNFYLFNDDLAQTLAEQSLRLCRDLGDQQGIAWGLQLAGYLFADPAVRYRLSNESLNLFQALGNKLGSAVVLQNMGYFEENYEQAKIYFQESESLYRELGHLAGLVDVLGTCGYIAIWQGDFDYARSKLEESLEKEQMMGYGNFNCLIPYGLLHYRLGDYQKAHFYLQKAVGISIRTGNIACRHFALAHLGYVYLRSGEIAKSYESFVDSLQQFPEMEHQEDIVYSLEGFASLAISSGQAEKAARLFAWADATRETALDRRRPVEQADVDRNVEAIIEMIGEEAYAAAYAEGKTMMVDQAIAEAMELKVELVGALNGDKTKP